MKTPAQTEGPFYPDKLPLDTDNDLLIINDDLTPAVGEITYLSGQVLDIRRQSDPQRAGRNLAGRRQRRVSPQRQRQSRQARRQLPGLRPVSDRLEGGLRLPHDQAGRLPRPHAAHSRRR